MVEEWRRVPGFAEFYEASDQGRLRRIATHTGRPKCAIITPHRKSSGYTDYYLCRDGLPAKRTLAHRIIWQAFVGPIPEGLQINHKNGLKADNRLANLEVVTPSENVAHRFRVLGHAAANNPSFGVKNGSAKLNPEKVREIRRLRALGEYQYVIAKKFGVTQRIIFQIEHGLLWSHVT